MHEILLLQVVLQTQEKFLPAFQPFTCEWFTQPDVALSEYADTIVSNMLILEETCDKLLHKSFSTNLKRHFLPVWENLEAPNKGGSSTSASVSDAKQVLRSMLDNDDLNATMEQMFQLSGTMFAMSVNYFISTALVRHPKEFGKIVSGTTKPAATFREKPSVKTMKDYVLQSFNEKSASSTPNLSRKASKKVTKAFIDTSSDSSDAISSSSDETLESEQRETISSTSKKN